MPDFDSECFFIAPIGLPGSDIRKRSDGVLKFVVAPAVEELGLEAVRADQIGQPGQITHQVVDHVLGAKAAVADLTGGNENVYYELAVRHAGHLPVVLIAEEDERDKLPFDLSQMRVIFFDHTDLESAAEAKDEIVVQMRRALDGAVDSPIATALNLQALGRGSSLEQTVAELVERVDQLSGSIQQATAWAHATPLFTLGGGAGRTSPLARSLVYPGESDAASNAAVLQILREVVDEAARKSPREHPKATPEPPPEDPGAGTEAEDDSPA